MQEADGNHANETLLLVKGIQKRFGGIRALRGVTLELTAGEILGIAGDNGAGKSTLIKIISGVYPPDSGSIWLKGARVNFESPQAARSMGIETIYQDLALAGNLDVASNIFLGREKMRRGLGVFKFLDRDAMIAEAGSALKTLDIYVPDLRAPTRSLSGGQQQSVAVARALYWNASIVIMDEPTAALAASEQKRVLELAKSLANKGVGVIFISHSLQENLAICGRIMVLRRGSVVGEVKVAPTTVVEEVIRLMVG